MKALFVLALAASSALAQQAVPTSADAIYYHGHILTGQGLAQNKPEFVSALAIRDGKILSVGDDASVLKFATAKTQKVDLGGAFVMPGFNDAHVHLGAAGRTKLTVDLTNSASLQEMTRHIHVAALAAAPGRWLSGAGWDHTLWTQKTLPTKEDLDAVSGDHPAFFERIDGHIGIANSAALKAADIISSTPDPMGGKIDRDAKGEPTGILRETAMALVEKQIPPPTNEERRRGLELAMADAVSHGVTSAQDNSDWGDFLVMEELEKDQKLPIRISEWLPFDADVATLERGRSSHPLTDPMLHTGMLKGFMDGSLGSRTAAMKTPFADDPGNAGIPRYEQNKLDSMTIERARHNFQIGFHAIGDRAASMALDAFAQAIKETAPKDPRYRIEHAQVVDPADIVRFKQLGVIASMQPNHLLTDMNWAEDRLGPQRAAYSYAWKAFLENGVHLAFGTDYPVEPITPFRGVYAAVTRKNEAGTKSYFPESRLTIGQALYAYTQDSAYAEHAETNKGKLLPGFFAVFVVLDRDLTRIAPEEILKTQVLRTVVNGKIAYLGNTKAS
jgi:predicted amidohydrolase YtcJ